MWAMFTLIMVLIALFFGLRLKVRPIANDVRWLPDENAIEFYGNGMAYVDDLHLFRSGQHYREFSIEMAVKAERSERKGFRPLSEVHDGDDRHQLV